MSKNNEIILGQLKEAGRALTAYEILDGVRSFGIKSPPQVYRSLSSLIDEGLVHKIESLNAFLACPHNHKNQNVVFLICETCKIVEEIHADSVGNLFAQQAKDKGFTPEQMTIEIKGTCRTCQASNG